MHYEFSSSHLNSYKLSNTKFKVRLSISEWFSNEFIYSIDDTFVNCVYF